VQVTVDTQDHTEPVVCEVFALKREALVLTAAEDADVGVVVGVDGLGVKKPRRWGAGRGLVFRVAGWSSGWRFCVHSVVTSVMAARAEVSSTMVLLVEKAAMSAWRARLLMARG
jgi:hypothetical protein